MNRRDFLQAAGLIACISSSSRTARGQHSVTPGWRTFELTTRIEIVKPSGTTHIWVPEPLISQAPFQRTGPTTWQGSGGIVKKSQNTRDALDMLVARFPPGVQPVLTVTSRASTRTWSADLSVPEHSQRLTPAERDYFLRATTQLPTDGIVRQKATAITKNAGTDLQKARAIYEWIVENTYRNPKTRGCGTGDIRFMLESGDLGGKCADLNALYVGLARAAGLPARDVYGIRAAPSQLGFKSLGVSSENVTKAQHCRAEVYLDDYGWVPVDPADVRKVMLEEPPHPRPLDDETVTRARKRLFGSWEMNWIAFNFGHDVSLPGSAGPPLHFLMYPQAETADGRLDCLNPETFRYEIQCREVSTV